jgi:hypothetical protein
MFQNRVASWNVHAPKGAGFMPRKILNSLALMRSAAGNVRHPACTFHEASIKSATAAVSGSQQQSAAVSSGSQQSSSSKCVPPQPRVRYSQGLQPIQTGPPPQPSMMTSFPPSARRAQLQEQRMISGGFVE